MNIAELSLKQRVLVNVIMIAVLLIGYRAMQGLTREVFPTITTNYITVNTIDPEISVPSDVEKLITIPLEEAISNVDGIKRLVSVSEQNVSRMFLQMEDRIEDMNPVLNEVRQQVDVAQSKLPATVESTYVKEMEIPLPVIILGLTYPEGKSLIELRPLVTELETDINSIPGVTDVRLAGMGEREVRINLDPNRLREYGVLIDQVFDVLNATEDVPAGQMDTRKNEIQVRVLGDILEPESLYDILVPSESGQMVYIRDLGWIENTFERERNRGRVDGSPAVTLTVSKQKSGDTIQIVKRVREIVKKFKKQIPEGVDLTTFNDSSKYIRTRLNTLKKNGLIALSLVTLLLLLFLNWRIALMVAIGLPFCFAGTFLVMQFAGLSLNMLSLFAMIMTLGMLVDDAVIVCENVYRYIEKGFDPYFATIKGTMEVAWPVIGTVLTTIAAFLPLMLTAGIIGKFLSIVPVIVSTALLFSLFESLIILPVHIADFVRKDKDLNHDQNSLNQLSVWKRIYIRLSTGEKKMRAFFDRFLKFVISIYRYFLKHCLRRRYITIGVAFMFIILAGVLAKFVLRFQLFPTEFYDLIYVKVETPPSYSLEATEDVLEKMENEIFMLPKDDFLAVVTQVGLRTYNEDLLRTGSNQGMITIDVDDLNPKARNGPTILRDIRQRVSQFPEATFILVEPEKGGPPVGKPINVRLYGIELESIKSAAEEFMQMLSTLPGVRDINMDLQMAKPEIRITFNKEHLKELNVRERTASRYVRAAFQGLEVQKTRWGNDEITFRIKFDESFFQGMEDIHNMQIPTLKGGFVPLSSIADVRFGTGLAEIAREGQRRVINVSADTDIEILTSIEAEQQIRPKADAILEKYPNVSIKFAGESEDTAESLESMKNAAIVAIALIFIILSGILRSFLQPLLVMSVVPFGVVAVFMGLIFTREPIGLMAIMGTIALSGIIVNDSLVMVSFINDYRRKKRSVGKMTRWRSLLTSGQVRFRPIMLTTITTVAGLWSLAFLVTGQEKFLSPMAIAIIFGLIFGTVITLVIVPCLIAVSDDFKDAMGKIFKRDFQ